MSDERSEMRRKGGGRGWAHRHGREGRGQSWSGGCWWGVWEVGELEGAQGGDYRCTHNVPEHRPAAEYQSAAAAAACFSSLSALFCSKPWAAIHRHSPSSVHLPSLPPATPH